MGEERTSGTLGAIPPPFFTGEVPRRGGGGIVQSMPIRKPHPNARKLRKDMPSAEKRLWYFIRRKQLGEFRFRRQHTIGPYIADFVCVEAKLVIELDGEQHGKDEATAYDQTRNAFMEREGWVVVRFWNNEVYDNIDGVLEAILDAAMNSVRAMEIEKSESDEG